MSSNKNQRTITSLVQDRPGVLSRISGLFRRRGFNIASLAVGSSEKPGLSRMTFVVEGSASSLRSVAEQLDKLIDVVLILRILLSYMIIMDLKFLIILEGMYL